jgi:hypothetical protein
VTPVLKDAQTNQTAPINTNQTPNEIIKNQKAYILHVTKYVNEKQKYDEILSAIGEYFELFKTHTELLEDLWLQILEYLALPNP